METVHDGSAAPAAVRWIAKAEVAVVGAILVVSLFITLTTIIERNLGHSTGDWSLKLPELMLVWMTFLGMGALVTEHGHVSADMLLRNFSPRWQQVAETVSTAITGTVLAVIMVGAVSIVRQQLDIGATDEELWGAPEALLLSIMPLGLGITILHLIAEIYVIWRPKARP